MSEFNAEKIEIPSESLPFIDEADVIVVERGTLGLIAATAKNNGRIRDSDFGIIQKKLIDQDVFLRV